MKEENNFIVELPEPIINEDENFWEYVKDEPYYENFKYDKELVWE